MVRKGKQPAPRHDVSRTGTPHVSAVVPMANTQRQRDEKERQEVPPSPRERLLALPGIMATL